MCSDFLHSFDSYTEHNSIISFDFSKRSSCVFAVYVSYNTRCVFTSAIYNCVTKTHILSRNNHINPSVSLCAEIFHLFSVAFGVFSDLPQNISTSSKRRECHNNHFSLLKYTDLLFYIKGF